MQQLLKLSHYRHSLKHRPHEHTSYPLLALMLLITGSMLGFYTYSTHATSPPPQAESVSLTGAMPGPPPETAGTITSPLDQQRFTSSPITVSGTCPEGTLVEILKNNIFAGSTLCSDEGTFSVDIDLLIGENRLTVWVYNSLNQPGPPSDVVTVFYDAVPPQDAPLSPLDFSTTQLLLNTDSIYRGTFPHETLTMPIEIIDGTPPFALEVRWGDNASDIVPRNSNQPFNINHVYRRPGTYQVSLEATDAIGRKAFLNVVAIVNGKPSEVPAGTGTTGTGLSLTSLYALWPIFAATLGMVLSFWMGEQREKRLLASHGVLINDPA